MLECVFVNSCPAFAGFLRVSQRALADGVRRTLRRHKVQDVIRDGDSLIRRIIPKLKDGFLLLGMDFNQFVVEARIDSVAVERLIQYGCTLRGAVN